MTNIKILLIDPFLGGSHKRWALEYQQFSNHTVEILGLSAHHWKWRMHGGAVSLARKFNKLYDEQKFVPDIILATDMLDLTTFLSLTREKTANIPVALYFHENQLTYPWSPTDPDVSLDRDNHYAFINYASALSADAVFFNSQYHYDSFFQELPRFLNRFPDNKETATIEQLKSKSSVLHLGIDLQKLQNLKPKEITVYNRAVLLWNHRWEYDKNPEDFFKVLKSLWEKGIEFKLLILGESYEKKPAVFEEMKEYFGENVLHYGFAEKQEDYINYLHHADILPVTADQDFFGISVVEALACNVIPLLPKRLAYTEHIPKNLQNPYFYDDLKDMANRLQRQIMNVRILRKQEVQQYAMQYDWGNQAIIYDKVFSDLVAK